MLLELRTNSFKKFSLAHRNSLFEMTMKRRRNTVQVRLHRTETFFVVTTLSGYASEMSKITLHEITEDDTDAAQTMMHATRSKFMSMIDAWLGDLTQIVLHENNNIQINVAIETELFLSLSALSLFL